MHDEVTQKDIERMQEEIEYRKLVVRKQALEAVKEAFGPVQIVNLKSFPDEFAFITSVMPQKEYRARAQKLGSSVITMIRVKDL